MADAFGNLKSSASFLAASVDDIQQSSIAKLHIVPDASTTNKTYRRKNFHSNEYVTEEEALKDLPLTDVRMTVSVGRSSIQLKGNPLFY